MASTGHERFRALCDDGNPDIPQRDGYRALMVSQATGRPFPAPKSRPSIRATLEGLEAARKCSHRILPACGCSWGSCRLHEREVAAQECIACKLKG